MGIAVGTTVDGMGDTITAGVAETAIGTGVTATAIGTGVGLAKDIPAGASVGVLVGDAEETR